MSGRLKVTLIPGWAPSPESNAGARPAFVRTVSQSPGVLQIHTQSFYRRGPIPNPSVQQLIELASQAAQAEHVVVSETSSGSCQLGSFGTVVGTCPGYARAQVWAVSNGRDFFVLSHVCASAPEPQELAEAQGIIEALTVGPAQKPWWRFW